MMMVANLYRELTPGQVLRFAFQTGAEAQPGSGFGTAPRVCGADRGPSVPTSRSPATALPPCGPAAAGLRGRSRGRRLNGLPFYFLLPTAPEQIGLCLESTSAPGIEDPL